MTTRKAKPERDVTKAYPLTQFADKLRRLADAVEGWTGSPRVRVALGTLTTASGPQTVTFAVLIN